MRLMIIVTLLFIDWAVAKRTSLEKETTDVLWFLQLLVPDRFIESNVGFYLYTKYNVDAPQEMFINKEQSISCTHFDVSRKTKIIVHGYDTNYMGTTVQQPKDKYLQYNDYNVIALDFGNINGHSLWRYMTVVAYSYKIGRFLGEFVSFLIDEGVNPDDVHIIGHSLGAHIAGYAGKYTKAEGKLLGRITGLDPCYPGYENNSPAYRLSSDDGQFTDCIFTDYDNLAMGFPVCMANFFPNGVGISQPGCYREDIFGSCSHSRSADLFTESIEPDSSFSVKRCINIPRASEIMHCLPTNDTKMGQYANQKAMGIYFLKTNEKYPYSQG